MALKGGFKNFANQTREIKETPPIDLGAEVPALRVVQEEVSQGGLTSRPPAPPAPPVPATRPAPGGTAGGAEPAAGPRDEKGSAASRAASEADEAAVPRHTHYTELVRKELRLHADQADELTVLASRVQRARKEKGERITDNTLIRVAVDLLLQRQKELTGSTEDELRIALGLAPRT